MVVVEEPGERAAGLHEDGLAVGPAAVGAVEARERGGQEVVGRDGGVGVPGQRAEHVERRGDPADRLGPAHADAVVEGDAIEVDPTEVLGVNDRVELSELERPEGCVTCLSVRMR